MNAKDHAINWIIQYLAAKNNYALLSTFYASDPYFNDADNPPRFVRQTKHLLAIVTLKNKVQYTPYEQLSTLIQPNNIFTLYHSLYPSIPTQQEINTMTKQQTKDLRSRIRQLFENEIELKVQIILSTNHWQNNYILHKKLNDQLLHENHYKNTNNNGFIPPITVIAFMSQCANTMTYIRRIHQQLNYLGQQCTKPNINLNNAQDSTVQKINDFLHKHEFKSYQTKILQYLDAAQENICGHGNRKDFLTRLAKSANIQSIIDGGSIAPISPPKAPSNTAMTQTQTWTESASPSLVILPPKATKYGLRTVVDVQINNNWCSGTIIKRFEDGSVNIALHGDGLDENGKYKYDSHRRIRADKLCKVVHCINEDGEYEFDDNPKCCIDKGTKFGAEWSSPIKQEEIRHEKLSQQSLSQSGEALSFDSVLANRNRNNSENVNVMRNLECELGVMDIDGEEQEEEKEAKEERIRQIMATSTGALPSQSSDLSEPNVANPLSPNSIDRKRNERTQQFKKRTSPRRRKRNRQEFEKKQARTEKTCTSQSKSNEATANPQKKRRIQAGAQVTGKKDEANKLPQRRQSQRLLQRRNSSAEKERKNKKRIQTRITATKDKKMTVSAHKDINKNKNKNKKKDDENGESEGEEQQWSDDMSEDMKKLNEKTKESEKNKNKNKRKQKKNKWSEVAQQALKKCYAKHDEARKKVSNYAIWEQIKRDDDYCHHWQHRTAHALRDKARLLLALNKSKKD